jgi:hypothetical protein
MARIVLRSIFEVPRHIPNRVDKALSVISMVLVTY